MGISFLGVRTDRQTRFWNPHMEKYRHTKNFKKFSGCILIFLIFPYASGKTLFTPVQSFTKFYFKRSIKTWGNMQVYGRKLSVYSSVGYVKYIDSIICTCWYKKMIYNIFTCFITAIIIKINYVMIKKRLIIIRIWIRMIYYW